MARSSCNSKDLMPASIGYEMAKNVTTNDIEEKVDTKLRALLTPMP